MRKSQFIRHLLGLIELLVDRGVGGPATHSEVVTGHHDRPSFNAAAAEEQIRGREAGQGPVGRVGSGARNAADLAKAARIEQPRDSFTHGELALGMLDSNLVRPTHGLRGSLSFA